jgi:hypothetical protein
MSILNFELKQALYYNWRIIIIVPIFMISAFKTVLNFVFDFNGSKSNNPLEM